MPIVKPFKTYREEGGRGVVRTVLPLGVSHHLHEFACIPEVWPSGFLLIIPVPSSSSSSSSFMTTSAYD